jgi:hypothetical protein
MPMSDSGRSFAEAKLNVEEHRSIAVRLGTELSLEISAGIEVSDVLIKKGAVISDVRVRITRMTSGMEVSLHGLLDGEEWALPDSAPRLIVSVNDETKVASIHLVTESGAGRQSVLIDQMNLSG